MMDRKAVKSSTISSIGFDENGSVLEVEFKSGGIYQYIAVPKAVHEEFMAALSQGKYLAQHIKERYRTVKVR